MNKLYMWIFILATQVALVTNASAIPITLDFEGVGDLANVDNFYNGGTDSQGNSGVNYGIGFGSNTLALSDQ